MTNYFHLRLTFDIESDKYKTYAEQRTQEHILVKENADEDCKQTHLHLHCKTLHKNDQAYRREVKKWFPALQGNAHYSLKTGNEKGYHYVCKGTSSDWDTGKPNVLSTSFSEDQIKEFHRMYWNHANRIKVILPDTIEEKKPRSRHKQFTEKIAEELVMSYPDKLWNMEIDSRFLVKYLYGKLGKIAKGFNQTKFNEMMNGLYGYLPKEHHVAERDIETLHVGYINRRF